MPEWSDWLRIMARGADLALGLSLPGLMVLTVHLWMAAQWRLRLRYVLLGSFLGWVCGLLPALPGPALYDFQEAAFQRWVGAGMLVGGMLGIGYARRRALHELRAEALLWQGF